MQCKYEGGTDPRINHIRSANYLKRSPAFALIKFIVIKSIYPSGPFRRKASRKPLEIQPSNYLNKRGITNINIKEGKIM